MRHNAWQIEAPSMVWYHSLLCLLQLWSGLMITNYFITGSIRWLVLVVCNILLWHYMRNYNFNAVFACVVLCVLSLNVFVFLPTCFYLKKRLMNPFTGEKMSSKEDWNNFLAEVKEKDIKS